MFDNNFCGLSHPVKLNPIGCSLHYKIIAMYSDSTWASSSSGSLSSHSMEQPIQQLQSLSANIEGGAEYQLDSLQNNLILYQQSLMADSPVTLRQLMQALKPFSEKLTSLEGKLTSFEGKLTSLEGAVQQINHRLDKNQQSVDKIKQELGLHRRNIQGDLRQTKLEEGEKTSLLNQVRQINQIPSELNQLRNLIILKGPSIYFNFSKKREKIFLGKAKQISNNIGKIKEIVRDAKIQKICEVVNFYLYLESKDYFAICKYKFQDFFSNFSDWPILRREAQFQTKLEHEIQCLNKDYLKMLGCVYSGPFIFHIEEWMNETRRMHGLPSSCQGVFNREIMINLEKILELFDQSTGGFLEVLTLAISKAFDGNYVHKNLKTKLDPSLERIELADKIYREFFGSKSQEKVNQEEMQSHMRENSNTILETGQIQIASSLDNSLTRDIKIMDKKLEDMKKISKELDQKIKQVASQIQKQNLRKYR